MPVLLARDFAAAAGDRDGAIVFISTMQGTAIFPGSTTYAAPKAALIHAARILAKQWKIRVVSTMPEWPGKAFKAGSTILSFEKKIIPRFGCAEDIARAVLFFLEPDNYVTGQVLTVNGGLSEKM